MSTTGGVIDGAIDGGTDVVVINSLVVRLWD